MAYKRVTILSSSAGSYIRFIQVDPSWITANPTLAIIFLLENQKDKASKTAFTMELRSLIEETRIQGRNVLARLPIAIYVPPGYNLIASLQSPEIHTAANASLTDMPENFIVTISGEPIINIAGDYIVAY